jgi:hypothetical protein
VLPLEYKLQNFRKIKPGPELTPCWLWTGHTTSQGYGRVKRLNKSYFIHRLSYIRYKGPIPEGLEIDHLCSRRNCYNPAHLEAVTHKENCVRGKVGLYLLKRTACPKGHKYTQTNTGYTVSGTKQIRRYCRKCGNLRHRKIFLDKIGGLRDSGTFQK